MGKKNQLRILKVEPGKAPEEKQISNNLDSLQAEVGGGCIECIDLENDTVLVCNDEGKLNGMEMNRRLGDDIICGPFFLVGESGEDFASLTDEQLAEQQVRFAQPEQFADFEPDAQPRMTFFGF